MAYDLADVIPLTVTIRDANGDAADGGTVVLTITRPDGTIVTPTPAHPSTGVYQVDYQPTMPGRHTAVWASTGANASGYSDAFEVRAPEPPYIASLEDLKKHLNMTSTTDDEELRLYLEAATGVVERHLRQAVVRRTFVEQKRVTRGQLVLNWTPVVEVTELAATDGSGTWDVADLAVSPGGVVTTVGGSALRGDLTVTYTAGMPIVPADYSLAGLVIAQHLWETQRGTAGAPFPGGLDMPGAGITSFGYSIPNRAKELLGFTPPLVG